MTNRNERFTAAILSLLMVLSLVAMAGGGLTGAVAADGNSDVDVLETDDEGPVVDPALENASGTEQVYLVFEQYDGTASADRERAIEQLQEHAEASQTTVREEIAALDGVELINTYWITNAVRAEVDASSVDTEELASIEGVETIQLRPEYKIPEPAERPATEADDDEYTYGLTQINATDVWDEFDITGEDVKVAVLDTGFDVSHQDLDLYTEDEDDPTYPGGWVEIGPDGEPVDGSEPHDTHYHGTHVGGTVGADVPDDNETPTYGVAPNVDMQHALVLPGGSGADSDTIAGFEYVVEEMDSDVVSMSFGAGCGLFGPVYEDAWIPAIQNANDMGVVAVTSSGNSGEGCVSSPANIYESFSIGASDEDGEITDFSSGNTIEADNWDNPDPDWPDEWIKPNVAAPGDEVLSAMPDDEYDYLSGTSMAAPHAAGTVALMLSANDDLSQEEIETVLEETAWKPDGEPEEKDVRYGHGIIDAHAAVDDVGISALEYDLGDVNQDDAVNVEDVQLMQQHLQDMEPENFTEELGDMNRDGEITTTDLTLLQQKVQGALEEGAIEVMDLEAPNEVDQGEEIEVTVALENLGDEGAVQEIEFHLSDDPDDLGDGEPVATEVADLAAPGVDDPVDHPAETTITFELDTSDLAGGEYVLGVSSDDDAESDALTVLGSHFDVSNIEAPDEVDRGEEVEVSADLENTGNIEDMQTVEFRFDDLDTALLAENVTLEADEETTVSFDVDTEDVPEGTYEHGIFSENDAETEEITILEAFFEVDITDAPDELVPGETYDVTAIIENTGDAPDEQEVVYDLGDAGGDVAVVDVESDTSQGEAVAGVLDDRLDNDTYDVDVVTASDLLDEMDEYDTFVIQRFGSDTVAEDFLDDLDSAQNAVYLDSHQGGTAEAYADGVYRLNNVREDPAERDSEGIGTSGEPVTIDIEHDHDLFTGVGESGDTVTMFTGSTTWGSWFDDYSDEVLADADFGNGYEGPSVAVSDDGDEVLLTATARDFFTDEADFTEEANQLLTNAVEYATTDSVSADVATVDSSELVSLEPGGSDSVAFEYTVPGDTDAGDASHIVSSHDHQDTAPVSIDPAATGHVDGTVFDDATEDPIENATVELEAEDSYTDVTDGDGAFALESVPAGEYDLTVTVAGYEEKTERIEVGEDETVTKHVGLHAESGTISGEVTASDDDESVENVTIVAENSDGDVYEATTDAIGAYTLENVSAGTYVVTVADTPPGFEPEEIVTVAPGEHVDGVDFEIDRLDGKIDGHVTNAAGIPIEDATVVDADGDAFNVSTDADGSYEIDGVAPGTHALRADAEGYDESNIEFVDVEAGETTTENLTLGTYFEVADLEAPETADRGEEITVSATVTNTGDQSDTRTVFYFPPGTDFGTDVFEHRPELSETVTLEGGESTTVGFTYEIPADDELGEYEHGISADEIESTQITIEGDDDGEAVFDVTSLEAPSEAEPNAEITVNATLENIGDDAGTHLVEYYFDGGHADETDISLEADETTTLEFVTELPAEEDTYEHAVASEDTNETTQTTVEVSGDPEPAYFEVTDIDGPEIVDPGSEFTTNATITNTGDETDEQTIFLFWDGAAEEVETYSPEELSETVGSESMATTTLEGGESTVVSLSHELDADTEPDTYQYSVSTLQEVDDREITVSDDEGTSIHPVRAGADIAPGADIATQFGVATGLAEN